MRILSFRALCTTEGVTTVLDVHQYVAGSGCWLEEMSTPEGSCLDDVPQAGHNP